MDIQTLKRKTRLGNQGFSLVELIIVIAIMAILIAVLAPMFIRYVERSRITRDVDAVAEMAGAAKTAASDPVLNVTSDFIVITWDGARYDTVATENNNSGLTTIVAIQDIVGGNPNPGDVPAVSRTVQNTGVPIVVTVEVATGVTTAVSALGTNANTGDRNQDYMIESLNGIR